MTLEIKSFQQLTTNELYEVLQLRSEVFVVEQECVYQDIDGNDLNAIHFLGKQGKQVVAYARILKAGTYFKEVAIGRVVVQQAARKKGWAQKIMIAALKYVKDEMQETKVTLSAQTYLIQFYESLGFKTVGAEYLEDGISHIQMQYSSAP